MIPIIINWGEEAKKVCEAGLARCPNCQGVVGLEVWRTAKTAGAYYLKLLKWHKEYWLVCPACQAGAPLSQADFQRIRAEGRQLPSNDTALSLYSFLTESFGHWLEALGEKPSFVSAWVQRAKKALRAKGHATAHVEYILAFWMEDNWEDIAPFFEAEAAAVGEEDRTPEHGELAAYLATLGLPADTTETDAVKKAYRELALKWHPDAQRGKSDKHRQAAQRKMVELNAAYAAIVHALKSPPARGDSPRSRVAASRTEAARSPSAPAQEAAGRPQPEAAATTKRSQRELRLGAPAESTHSGHQPTEAAQVPEKHSRWRTAAGWACVAGIVLLIAGTSAIVYKNARPAPRPINGTVTDALAAIEAGQLARAQGIVDYLKARTPNDWNVWDASGLLNTEQQRWRLAVSDYQRAISLNESSIGTCVMLAHAYEGLGEPAKAQAFFEAALAISPRDALDYAWRGDAYEALGRPQETIQALTKAVSLDPNDPDYHLALGRAFADEKLYTMAIACFRKVLALRPGSTETRRAMGSSYSDLGLIYYNRSRYADAASAFRRATELNPQSETAWAWLGLVSNKLGRHQEAFDAYRTAVALNPAAPSYQMGWAHACAGLGLRAQAVQALRNAAQLDPFGTTGQQARAELRSLGEPG